jgi:hypothetical protein
MAIISLPRVLREKLGDEGADSLIELINKATEKTKEDTLIFVEEKFERRLAEVKSDIIKWMFIFWVGQIGVLTGVLFAFFR